jgi:hypothetical protein
MTDFSIDTELNIGNLIMRHHNCTGFMSIKLTQGTLSNQ